MKLTLRFLGLFLLALSSALLAGEPESVTNEKYGFKLTFPSDWKVDRVQHPDPFPDIKAFKSGQASLGGSVGTLGSGEAPVDWNAVYLNQSQAAPLGETPPLPVILIYAHEAPAKSFEEFSAYFKEFITLFRMEVVSARTVSTASGLEAYDYVYRMGPIPVRVCVLFRNGKRYGLTYFERDQKSFEEHAKYFDEVVKSFEVLPAPGSK